VGLSWYGSKGPTYYIASAFLLPFVQPIQTRQKHTQPKIRPKLKKQSHPHSYHLNRKSSFQRHLIRNLKFKRLERLLSSQPFPLLSKKKKTLNLQTTWVPSTAAAVQHPRHHRPFFLDSRKLASHIYSLPLTTTCQKTRESKQNFFTLAASVIMNKKNLSLGIGGVSSLSFPPKGHNNNRRWF
jgi:hypothetical protein